MLYDIYIIYKYILLILILNYLYIIYTITTRQNIFPYFPVQTALYDDLTSEQNRLGGAWAILHERRCVGIRFVWWYLNIAGCAFMFFFDTV